MDPTKYMSISWFYWDRQNARQQLETFNDGSPQRSAALAHVTRPLYARGKKYFIVPSNVLLVTEKINRGIEREATMYSIQLPAQ
jgi:hypothetical protein